MLFIRLYDVVVTDEKSNFDAIVFRNTVAKDTIMIMGIIIASTDVSAILVRILKFFVVSLIFSV